MIHASFSQIARAAYTNSREKGFYDEGIPDAGRSLALMHSEVTEAFESMMAHGWNHSSSKTPLFLAVEEEMADLILRLGDFSAARGLDVEGALKAHMSLFERPVVDPVSYGLCTLHARISAVLETWRKPPTATKPKDGWSGREIAVAGVLHAVLAFAVQHRLRLAEAVEAKMAFNANRPRMHGDKTF